MKKKRFLFFAMAITLMTFAFAACGDDDDESEPKQQNTTGDNINNTPSDNPNNTPSDNTDNQTDNPGNQTDNPTPGDNTDTEVSPAESDDPIGAILLSDDGDFEIAEVALSEDFDEDSNIAEPTDEVVSGEEEVNFGDDILGASWYGRDISNINWTREDFTLPALSNWHGTCYYGNFDYTVKRYDKQGAFVVTLVKEKGFVQSGTAYLKVGGIGGAIRYAIKYKAGQKKVNLILVPKFTTGVEVIYPMTISDDGPKTRSFANPITLFSSPMSNQTTSNLKTLGHVFGTVNGVEVKCNGVDSQGAINCTIENYATVHIYQCVHYVKQYISKQYGLNISGGNANNWFTSSTVKKHFYAYSNGGKDMPMPGDIICFKATSSKGQEYGHVGIITRVTSNCIEFAQQNGGKSDAIGERIYFSQFGSNGYTLKKWSGYTIQGWLHPKQRY